MAYRREQPFWHVDGRCGMLTRGIPLYRGPRIDGTNGTSTKMASMKFQPHMLVQCVPSIGSRQNAKNLLFVAICKSHLRALYIYKYRLLSPEYGVPSLRPRNLYTCLTGQVYKYPVGYAIYKPLNPVYPIFAVFLSLDGIFDVSFLHMPTIYGSLSIYIYDLYDPFPAIKIGFLGEASCNGGSLCDS